jgi:hypothetical protein
MVMMNQFAIDLSGEYPAFQVVAVAVVTVTIDKANEISELSYYYYVLVNNR